MNVNQISDYDARAMYRFIAALGVRGERMPAAVGPETEPSTPYFMMEPQFPAKLAAVVVE